jgi:hypothetical protein
MAVIMMNGVNVFIVIVDGLDHVWGEQKSIKELGFF